MSTPLLIPEPPLQLLRSLAAAVGLNEAIVLQQLHYRQQQSGDGWLRRTHEEWQQHDFPFWGKRTIIRVFESLRVKRLIEVVGGDGTDRALRYRVLYDALPCCQVGNMDVANLACQVGNMGSRRKEEENNSLKSLFTEWLANHCETTGSKAMSRPGTAVYRRVQAAFERAHRDHPDVDLRLISSAAMADPNRVKNGWLDPLSVLRPAAVERLLERGRVAAVAADDWAGSALLERSQRQFPEQERAA